jgi:3-oxoacyl-[acyl-carrier protein] reductase
MATMDGRVVVVTGAASGIGLEIARAFACVGAAVEAWDVRAGSIDAAASRLAEDGVAARFSLVDVSRAADVERACADLVARRGRVDVLVNNAGIHIGPQTAAALSAETLRAMLAVNLEGAVNCVRHLAPVMVSAGSGVIINSASALAQSPLPGTGAYAASKAAVVAISRAWARELGPSGVRVNVIAAGFIDTPMNAKLSAEVRQALVTHTALRRVGRPEDVAGVALFLASEAAAFVTGAVIPVDGGLVI